MKGIIKDKDRNVWLEGMMGVVVGDALGLSAQFIEREALKDNPIKTMEGYGIYNMPAGTWSDDSSMALATLDSLQEKQGVDLYDIMEKFCQWLLNGKYTPFGQAFDQGNTCVYAISNFAMNHDEKSCGKTGERANGNGALMRIMPVCLYAYFQEKAGDMTEEDAVEVLHRVAALTHNHLRSNMACGFYYFMVKAILDMEGELRCKLQAGVDNAVRFYHKEVANLVQMAYYGRLFHLDEFVQVPESEIKSSGYVVDSLEAAVWSLITTDSFREAALKAVNLGDDTDTIGAIACGLAALHYGYDAIPGEWLSVIQRREWIEEMCK